MAMPNDLATVEQVASEGYFEKARNGDQRACSLFARLCAYRLNPNGDPNGWGWLTKSSGETGVDGYAEDAMVYGSNQGDLNNVVDIITGAGQAGASPGWAQKPRRQSNQWAAPRALTAEELNYLKPGGAVEPGKPTPPAGKVCPDPSAHVPKPKPGYPGDAPFDVVGAALFADYAEKGEAPNKGMSTWFARTIWDHINEGMTLSDAIGKHRAAWRRALGLPVQP